MLAGMIVIEDLTITYKVSQAEGYGPPVATYTVCNAFTGQEETVRCDAPTLMKALGVALNFEWECVGDYEALVAIQPINKKLRFIR